jgi:hypothetical protein
MNYPESQPRQPGSPQDAHGRPAILVALALAAAILSGCAGMGAGGSPADAITIERIDSAHAEIASAQVGEAPGGIQVRGRLQKRFAGRSPIQGHLHVEALDADGALLAQAMGTYRRLSPKMGLSEFTQTLAVSADQVQVVRITHHLEHTADG